MNLAKCIFFPSRHLNNFDSGLFFSSSHASSNESKASRHSLKDLPLFCRYFVTKSISLNILAYFLALLEKACDTSIGISDSSSVAAVINSVRIWSNLSSITFFPLHLVSLCMTCRNSVNFLRTAEFFSLLYVALILSWTISIVLDKSAWRSTMTLTS